MGCGSSFIQFLYLLDQSILVSLLFWIGSWPFIRLILLCFWTRMGKNQIRIDALLTRLSMSLTKVISFRLGCGIFVRLVLGWRRLSFKDFQTRLRKDQDQIQERIGMGTRKRLGLVLGVFSRKQEDLVPEFGMPILDLEKLDWVWRFCFGIEGLLSQKLAHMGILGLELLGLGHMMFKIGLRKVARTIKIWPYRG